MFSAINAVVLYIGGQFARSESLVIKRKCVVIMLSNKTELIVGFGPWENDEQGLRVLD